MSETQLTRRPPPGPRSDPGRAGRPAEGVRTFGPFRLDLERRVLRREDVVVPLGSRAFDLLAYLTEKPGEVLSKAELLDQVWPDVVVEEGSLRFHMNALRKSLSDGQDGAQYIVTTPGRGYSFVAPVGFAGDPAPGGGAPAPALPRLPPRLVGREPLIEEVCGLLAHERLVTLVGPGGIGKTTVAVAAARRFAPAFAGRVVFVDLGQISEGGTVGHQIASALGVRVPQGDPLGAVVSACAEPLLLILDCCERVVAAAAAAAETLVLSSAPISVLATSRETLRVEGETLIPVTALESPDPEQDIASLDAADYPATQLFIDHARARGASAELQGSDLALIASICRKLDGIPLAIQLAASAVAIYGLRGTATLVETHFGGLGVGLGVRTAAERHRTLTATLDWSYELLTEAEKLLLRRLAVFSGGFSLEGAEAVVGREVLDAHAGLISKSLLTPDLASDQARFRLLDTTRAYAREKLRDSGEEPSIAGKHAEHLLNVIAKRRGPGVAVSDASLLRQDLAEVGAALEWCFGPGDAVLGIRLVGAAGPAWVALSRYAECCYWIERATARLDDATRGTPLELALLYGEYMARLVSEGTTPTAERLVRRIVQLAATRGDPAAEFQAQVNLLTLLFQKCETLTARGSTERAMQIARQTGDDQLLVHAHNLRAIMHFYAGEHRSFAEHVGPALSTDYNLSHQWSCRYMAAVSLWLGGRPDSARRFSAETLALAATTEQPIHAVQAQVGAMLLRMLMRETGGVRELLDSVSQLAEKHGIAPYKAMVLGVDGALQIAQVGPAAGLPAVEEALALLRRYQLYPMLTLFTLERARALLSLGRWEEAASGVQSRLREADEVGEGVYRPEMLRLLGEASWRSQTDKGAQAETLLHEALELAEGQGALTLALRSAMTLAEIEGARGASRAAAERLGALLNQYNEGFDTPDLQAARRLAYDLRT
jgi:predicted ATPase/DNA-binding winged helix-turn-helix (wHTH) protein